MKISLKIGLQLAVLLLIFFGCKKSDVLINGETSLMRFSNDTITFDTLFTTMGSVTKQLLVYNPNEITKKLTKIELAGGDMSMYQINVDGRAGHSFQDIEIAAGDSLYIFVRITIDPTNMNTPLIVKDSILFESNGILQDVDLYAWGQDAHFIMPNRTIQGLPPLNIIAGEGESILWTNDKPYVIVGYAVVDSLASLTIEAGTQIHFYNSSGLWIYKGAELIVNGSMEAPVVFQGSRLDEDYKDIPAQWDRIWINESAKNSVFNYAIIKNGTIGIQAETMSASMGNSLILNNTKILNMSGWGIFTRFYSIEANNILVANAGSSLLNITTGGRYRFKNSTFGNYWSYGVRNDPALHLSNYYIQSTAEGDIVYTGLLEEAYFGDCIFYGALEDEILIDEYPGTDNFNYLFDYCLIKSSLNSSLNSQSSYFNEDPLFRSPYEGDFHLDSLSGARNKGVLMSNFFDLDGIARDNEPDLGAYEYVSPTNLKRR